MSSLIMPTQMLPDKALPGVGADGETIKTINIKEDFANSYLVVVFFRIGTQEDAEQVLMFSDHLKDFEEAGCQILGVTSENPLSIPPPIPCCGTATAGSSLHGAMPTVRRWRRSSRPRPSRMSLRPRSVPNSAAYSSSVGVAKFRP